VPKIALPGVPRIAGSASHSARMGQGRLPQGVYGNNDGRMPHSRVRRWLILMAVPVGAALVGCGSTNATPPVQAQRPGVISGLAVQCSGLPGLPAHQVTVIVYRNLRIVAHRTELGSFTYRFTLTPGQYMVTTDQSYVVPVKVSLGLGQQVRADLISSCD
jgi:hypothetical protein